MPHVIVEYTDNLGDGADISGLLHMIAKRCAESDGVLVLAGVRIRAIRLTEYVIADGNPKFAFVNITVKLGQGRDPVFKKTFFGSLFEHIQDHFSEVSKARPLALSMYIEDIDENGAFRQNGIREALGLPPK